MFSFLISGTSTFVAKTVNQADVNTVIECRISKAPYSNVSWSLNNVPLSNLYIDRLEECRNLSGPFQFTKPSNSLVVCRMNYTVHQGNYTCYKDHGASSLSMTTSLNIEGMQLFTRLFSSLFHFIIWISFLTVWRKQLNTYFVEDTQCYIFHYTNTILTFYWKESVILQKKNTSLYFSGPSMLDLIMLLKIEAKLRNP